MMSYSPTLGRWMEEDPAGYVDGTDLYSFDMLDPASLSDPTGLTVQVVEVSPGPGNVDTAGDKAISDYIAKVTKDIATVEAIPDKRFSDIVAKGGVTFAGQPFTDTDKGVYVQRMKGELDSGVTRPSGDLDAALKVIADLKNKYNQPWDQLVAAVHGEYDETTGIPTGDVVINGKSLPQKDVVAKVKAALTIPPDIFVSCFNNPQEEEETYSPVGPYGLGLKGAGNPSVPAEACSIAFAPLKMGEYLIGKPGHLHTGVLVNPPTSGPTTGPGK